WFAAWQ
ncbi:3-octaprenyl-4-hydroxybenzoate carboxy-lyase family protein, partial [Vibrio parahaemolyticus VPTS-2010]